MCSENPEQLYISQSWVQAIFISLWVILLLVGVGGNVLVLYVILGNKHMRTTINIYLVNLAASDIIISFIISSVYPVTQFLGRWVFGDSLCKLINSLLIVSIYMSTFTLAAIAVNRYRAVFYPFSIRTNSLTRTVLAILCIDVAAIIISLPRSMANQLIPINVSNTEVTVCANTGWTSNEVKLVFGSFEIILQFVIPFTIIVLCYTSIVIRLRKRAWNQPATRTESQIQENVTRTERMNKMLIYMMVIFGVCWFPNNLYDVVSKIDIDLVRCWELRDLMYSILLVIAFSSSCYNPFLYGLMNPSFRAEFAQLCNCVRNTISIKNQVYEQHDCHGSTTQEGIEVEENTKVIR